MKALIPLLFAFIGIGIGAGAGLQFAPVDKLESCATEECPDEDHSAEHIANDTESGEEHEYLRMQNQFVIPVVRDELVRSLVVMSLSLEAAPGAVDAIYEREPKLRDAFLRVLFDHAHMGGFDGAFTESGRLSVLRVALLEAAQATLGNDVTDILITDAVRQEM
ncbi:MAG: flagellar basal body-associated FliL family protein [Boseongicola sp.]